MEQASPKARLLIYKRPQASWTSFIYNDVG
jgi:hypothetical protein